MMIVTEIASYRSPGDLMLHGLLKCWSENERPAKAAHELVRNFKNNGLV
jgi:hypothetical protein